MHGPERLNAILEEQILFIYSAGSFIVVNVERHFMVTLSHVIYLRKSDEAYRCSQARRRHGIVAQVGYSRRRLEDAISLPFDHMYYFLRQ